MNVVRPGSIQLSGRAYVENARPVPGKPRTVVLDVYFFGSPDQEKKEIACSLRFFKGDDAILTAGLYDVIATVNFIRAPLQTYRAYWESTLFYRLLRFVLKLTNQAQLCRMLISN